MLQNIQNKFMYKEEKNETFNNGKNINKEKKQNWISKKGGKEFLVQENINGAQKFNGLHQKPPKQIESNLGDTEEAQFYSIILGFSNDDQNNGTFKNNKNGELNIKKKNIDEFQNNRDGKFKKKKSFINIKRNHYKDNKNNESNKREINQKNVEKEVFNNQSSYELNNSSSSIIIIDNSDYLDFRSKNSGNLNEIKKTYNNINNGNNDINNKNNDNNIKNENNYNNNNKVQKYNLPSSTNINIISSNPYINAPVSIHKKKNILCNSSINDESLLLDNQQNKIDNNINNNNNNYNNNDNNNDNNKNYIINKTSTNFQVNESQKNNSISPQNNIDKQQSVHSQPYLNKINNDSNVPSNSKNDKNNISKSEKSFIKINNNNNSGNSNNQKVSKHLLDRYKKVSKTGLINVGDSSYINAILQSLGHVRPFASYFLNPKNQKLIESKKVSMPLSYATHRLFTHLYPYPESNTIEIYSPDTYLNILSFLKSPFGKQRNNPNDLLIFILNTLHEELNSKKSINIINEMPYDFYFSQDNVIQNGISNFINNNKSKISDVVSWFQLNETNCSKCGRSAFKFISFNTYDLDIKNTYEYFLKNEKKYININDCFSFGEMSKKCKSYCYNCKNRAIIYQKSRIYSSPNVFIFLLDRGIDFNQQHNIN